MRTYYRRWILKAFERPLGIFDIFTALVAVAGGAVTFFWPTTEHLVGELAWQLPAIAFVTLVVFGVFRAPYAMYREDQAAWATAIAARDQQIQAMFQLRLLHQPAVTFDEAASDPELPVNWHLLSRDLLLHRLLKALWRGDFGDGDDGNGDGALTFDGERYGRFRAVLHAALQWGGEHGLPTWSALMDEEPR